MNEFDEEGRKQRRNEKLGTNEHVCLACGFRGDNFQFERHHIAGRAFDKEFETCICVRCHREFTRQQLSLPKPSRELPPLHECVAHLCVGIAIVIEPIANSVEDYGRRLTSQARRRKRGDNTLQFEVGAYHDSLSTLLRNAANALRAYGNKLLGRTGHEADCAGGEAA